MRAEKTALFIKILSATVLSLLMSSFAIAAGISAANDPEAIDDLRIAKGNNSIAEAWLIAPTDRYQHYVLGSAYEPAGVRVRLANGENLTLMLGESQVFEDRQPRLADLDGDGRDEIVLVLSSLTKGAALAVYAVTENTIELQTRTPFIGRAFRWLNPAGIADFDGNGQLDIAFVAMPHLVKRLEFWTLKEGGLVPLGSVDDVSNHRNGSPHTAMSAVADFDGDGTVDLVVPAGDRRSVRVISFKGGKPTEIDKKLLALEADGGFKLSGASGSYKLDVPSRNGETVRLSF